MVRRTFVVAGLFLASLAFVLDATATTAEACCGCRRGCGYGGCGYGGCGYGGCGTGGCGYGGYYVSSYQGHGYYGWGYGGGSSCCSAGCGTACCSTPVYIAAPCCTYAVSGGQGPAYASPPRQQFYISPALPVSTYGLPVAMPQGSVLRTSPALVSYSR